MIHAIKPFDKARQANPVRSRLGGKPICFRAGSDFSPTDSTLSRTLSEGSSPSCSHWNTRCHCHCHRHRHRHCRTPLPPAASNPYHCKTWLLNFSLGSLDALTLPRRLPGCDFVGCTCRTACFHHPSVINYTSIMDCPIATEHAFPLSNARDAPNASESHVPQHEHRCKKIRLSRLREQPDHLTSHPKNGYRYVSASGKCLYDLRYAWPLDRCSTSEMPQPVRDKGESSRAKQKRQAGNAMEGIEVYLDWLFYHTPSSPRTQFNGRVTVDLSFISSTLYKTRRYDRNRL